MNMKWYDLKQNVIKFIAITIILYGAIIFFGSQNVQANEKNEYGNIESVEFSNMNSWKSGWYNSWNGQYSERYICMCLKEYATLSDNCYMVEISSDKFCMLICELDANKKFIKCVEATNDQIYIPSENAKYLGISVKLIERDWAMTYDKYFSLFEDGFVAQLIPQSISQTKDNIDCNEEVSLANDCVEMCDFSNIDSWKSGWYNNWNGQFANRYICLCLDEYKTLYSDTYKVDINSDEFCILINELDGKKKFIKCIQMNDGDTYIPSNNTEYLTVTVKKIDREWVMTYDKYVEMFDKGFVARLVGNNSMNKLPSGMMSSPSNVDPTPMPTIVPTQAPTSTPKPTSIPSPTPKVYVSFSEELKDMLMTGDMTTHNVAKYNLNYSMMYSVYNDLIAGECYVAYNSYINVTLATTTSNNVIQTVRLNNADKDFAYRYEKLQQVRKEALELIQPEMSEIEKLLILHEFIMKKTEYCYYTGCSNTVGPLVNGKAICSGYTMGLNFLLHEVGIESYFISSNSMNHSWNMVKIDGEFYHVDATWDDNYGGLHCYFVYNDTQFRNHAVTSHQGWVSYEIDATSTSTKYDNWFVHDVWGEMIYLNGYWYYAEDNTVKCAKIDGSEMRVVAEESSKVTINELKDGEISYFVDGVVKTVK